MSMPWHFLWETDMIQGKFNTVWFSRAEHAGTIFLCMDTWVSSSSDSVCPSSLFLALCVHALVAANHYDCLLLTIGQYKIKYVPLAWTFWGEGVSNSLEASAKDPWFAYEPFSQRDNTSITSPDPYVDMESSTCICICLMFFLFMTVGVPCLIVAGQCETAELRANNTALCKLIHSDESAETLRTVGWVFSLPFALTVLAAVWFCYAVLCNWENGSKREYVMLNLLHTIITSSAALWM